MGCGKRYHRRSKCGCRSSCYDDCIPLCQPVPCTPCPGPSGPTGPTGESGPSGCPRFDQRPCVIRPECDDLTDDDALSQAQLFQSYFGTDVALITQPSSGEGVVTISYEVIIPGVGDMSIGGYVSHSPLANYALFSSECAAADANAVDNPGTSAGNSGSYPSHTYLNLYEIMLRILSCSGISKGSC